jgi:integrase
MRIARFNIRKETKNGYTFWKIHVPKWINPSGKDGYAYFHTKAEAERKRGELIATTRSESKLMVLTNAQTTDAMRALERLAEHGLTCTLDKAVEVALPHLLASGRHVTAEQLCKEFAESKAASWSAVSKRNFATISKLFLNEFEGRAISEISGRDIESWLSARFPTAGYKANALRTIRPAFSWAVRQELLQTSPFEKVEQVRTRAHDGVDVFTPDEAARLMFCAPADCIAAFAILLFAGVRPTELTRLTWGNIREGFIHITPSIAKTQQVRNIELEPTLAAWLATTGTHQTEESICPPNWLRKRQETVKAAGLQGRTDTARHSYATYHLALHKDVNALKSNLGHSKGSDTLFVHYRAAATPADAERYWSILPHVKKS